MTALIFDCDGVLADTERDGHRVAFNQTFAEFGLPIQWSEEGYGRALKIAGGKERMKSLLTPALVDLFTRDAHGLYRQYGFGAPRFPDRLMERPAGAAAPEVTA